jgi:hypothetical protein
MDLQTTGGNPVTSDNAYPPANFRAYSQQTPDVSRQQPTTVGRPSEQITFYGSPHEVKIPVEDPGHLG